MSPNATDFTQTASVTVFKGKLPPFFPTPAFGSNSNGIVVDFQSQVGEDNGVFKSPYRDFARKCFRFASISNPGELSEDKEKFQQELDILYNAQHHHVIKLVFAYIFEPDKDDTGEPSEANAHGAIIMVRAKSFNEILKGPSIHNDKKRGSNFLKLFGCLAMTLDHIHGLGIRHRDIKPDNILMNEDNEVVLADFGISNMILGKTLSTTRQGSARARTVTYCAPEAEGGSSRTRSADIFALGVVFLEMLAKLRPGGTSDLQTALPGDASDSRDDSDQHQSYIRALERIQGIHSLMDNDWRRPKGPVWTERETQWSKLVSMCKNMTSEDPFTRPCALDLVTELSRIDHGILMPPCKCSNPPEKASARLLYICKRGLTDDLRLPHHLEDINKTVGAIHQASARGHLTIVKTLLANGFAAELRDHSGQTALHCAAAFGKHEVVKYLLGLPHVNTDSTDRKNRTALHYAAGNGSLEVVKMLLKSGQARLAANKIDEQGRTALHFAATRGHSQIIKELIKSDVREYHVDTKDNNGVTALHLAAGFGSVQAVDSLLESGANTAAQDEKERTVLQFAIHGIQKLDQAQDRGQYEEVIKRLLRKTRFNICVRVACGNAGIEPCGQCGSRRKIVCDFVAERSIESEAVELNKFIQLARSRFSTSDMERIAHLLERLYPRWHENGYKVERIYTVLKLSGAPFLQCAEIVDYFIQKGVTDYQLPLVPRSIGDLLATRRSIDKFIEVQSKFTSDTICFEEKGEHISLKHDEWSKSWGSEADIKPIYEDRVFRVTAEGHTPLVVKIITVKKRYDLFGRIELGVLKCVKHDHLVTFVGSFTTPCLLGIVTSPLARCNLEPFLAGVHEDDDLGDSANKMHFLASCFGCLVETLRYLHFDAHITHYDIKPQNILINGSGRHGLHVLLTGFGNSNDWPREHWRVPTPRDLVTDLKYMYCAPEIADTDLKRKVNSNVDIWSMGCVFLEMATVLKGYTIANLRRYFEYRGYSRNYSANSISAKEWTDFLSKPNGYAGSANFEWIQDMLNRRPSATLLYDTIKEVSCESSLPLFGPCCRPESTHMNERVKIRPACGLSEDAVMLEQSRIAAVAWDEAEGHRVYFQTDNGLIVEATRERRRGGWFNKKLEVVTDHAKPQSPIAATTWYSKSGLQRPTIRVYYLDAANRIRERAWYPLEEWKDGPLCRVEFRASPSSALAVTSWDSGRILVCYQAENGTLGMLLGCATMSEWRACETLPMNDLPRPVSNTSLALVNFPDGKGREFRLYFQVDGSGIREVRWGWDRGDRGRWDISKPPGGPFGSQYCLETSTNAVISATACVRQQRLDIRVYIADAGRLFETRYYDGEWMRPKRLPTGKGIRQLALVHWQKYISRYCVEEA